ncbi:MAG: hypothetical protein DMH00_10295 [Acidobacteria bacterium]|nr:MAG: hypothetical protein DMH00_10295 [Acidobacteriota bacterium]
MSITPEQRTYARLAGILFLAKLVLEGGGDGVTILAHGGECFAETARFAAENALLWRFALLNVGLAWIVVGIQAHALYVVLEPVNKRLAQLALVLRLGACFVGAASLMFRVAQARLYTASETEGLFTTEQLRTLVAVSQRAAGAGVTTAWMFLGTGSTLFFLMFLRSRYLPRALAGFGIFTSALLVAMAVVVFVFPQRTNELKLFGVPSLLTEVATALWLLLKGLHPRATAEATA